MLKSNLLKVSVLSLFVSPTLFAVPLKISGCKVTFLAKGKPGFLSINGTGADCSGTLESDGKSLTGEISSPMGKFASGIEMRDEHMRDKYMEVKKYPDAVLKVTKFETTLKDSDAKPFKGMLKFHGKEKEVEGTAKAQITNGKGTVEADYAISLKDFGIEVPTYAGVTVADEVKIHAAFDTEAGGAPVAAAPAPAAGNVGGVAAGATAAGATAAGAAAAGAGAKPAAGKPAPTVKPSTGKPAPKAVPAKTDKNK